VSKRRQIKPRRLRAPSKLEAARPEPLFDLLQDRLTFSDALKEQVSAFTPGEHLVQAQMMTAPPRSAAEREFYGQLLWANVCGRFRQTLSPAEHRLWEDPPDDLGTSLAHMRLLKYFDTFLTDQFRYWGPALLMSQGVLQRLFQWRIHDPNRMRLLAAELELNAKVFRGDAGVHLPLSEDLGAFKRQAKKELQVLFSRIRTKFSSRHRMPTPAEIAEFVQSTVRQQSAVFPNLHLRLSQLKPFLLNAPEPLVLGIVLGRTRAASFIDSWVAAATGYSVERARQEMSRSRS